METAQSDDDADIYIPDIEKLLARFAPPQTPSFAVERTPELADLLEKLDPLSVATLFGALQTEPQFQANICRWDWGVRLAVSLCTGSKKATRADLYRLINRLFDSARIAALEDPIEDFFVCPVGTPQGEFLVLPGIWEKAAVHTENVISAFSSLPDGEPKSEALRAIYALLRLSDTMVRRAKLGRYLVGGGNPGDKVDLPSQEKLRALTRRIKFSWRDLEQLGIDRDDLMPFTLRRTTSATVLDSEPGDSALDFFPLVAVSDGIWIIAPSNIVTAVRARLVDTAVNGGQGRSLQRYLLDAQAQMVTDSDFLEIPRAPVARFGAALARQYAFEKSKGYYVHVVQTMDGFDGFPTIAFGAAPPECHELGEGVAKAIESARDLSRKRDGFIEGVTFLVLGGWGRAFNFRLKSVPEQPDWPIIVITPADAIALARCEDATLEDIWRLHKQERLVEEQGFQLLSVNGVLNLFQWWRETDHGLLPEHWSDATPPMMINFPTDLLLKARVEGFEALDRRVLPYADGSFKTVMRLDSRAYVGELEPAYGSLDDIKRGDLLGAILAAPFVVWLGLDMDGSDPQSKGSYETWRGTILSMVRSLPAFYKAYGLNDPTAPLLITMRIEWPDEARAEHLVDDVYSTIELTFDEAKTTASVLLKPEWQWALFSPENSAEAALTVTLLLAISVLMKIPVERADVETLVKGSLGADVRWRHSFLASRVIDILKGRGLVGSMKSIPVSAGALAKCGSVWPYRARELGTSIEGREECGAFLLGFTQLLLQKLIAQVRCFNRRSLIIAALDAIQAAQGEDRQWDLTARAVRAIHGVEDDFRGSLIRSMEVNGVIRASSILVEVAVCEAPLEGGLEVGDMALAELQVGAMMVFLDGDLASAILGEGTKPALRISPTGEVLSDHDFEQMTLKKTAERRHETERQRHSTDYLKRFEPDKPKAGLAPDLRAALTVEYGADAETVLAIPAAAGDLAYDKKQGVFVIRRSEFVGYVEGLEPMMGQTLGPLIDRLSMPSRPDWSYIPPGCAAADFDLCKFDRRLSVIGRPLIPLDASDDPEIVVAPAVIERAIMHNLSGAMDGTLQNEFWTTKAMRTFASRAGAKGGLEFNDRLAEALKDIGLQAWPSAKPAWCLNTKATKEVEELGDVDVLAITKDGRQVWVVEAKDLKLCRTLGEATRRLSEYRGRTNTRGKPDKLLRHLQRVDYLRERRETLQKFFKLSAPPQVNGVIVVRAPQPMEHFRTHNSTDARVIMLDDINEVPWHAGWPST